jgi:outer membrane protein assembly factor BamE
VNQLSCAAIELVLETLFMRKMLVMLSILASLSGCSYFHVHKMDIEQGNVITVDMVSRVHNGMTQADVKDILGEPVLANVFDPNRLDYVYTYKPGNGQIVEKYITFIFINGRVSDIKGNLPTRAA